MAKRTAPLPEELRGRAFGIHEAEGVSRSRLRASDVWIPARGTRLPTELTSLRDRCAAHQLTLPIGAAFSHLTAARLLRLPLPRFDSADSAGTIDVTVPRGTRAPRRTGVVAHQRELEEHDVFVRGGLRITSPARTFLDLATVLTLDGLVAVGDRIIARRSPLATRARLEQRLAGSSARGVRLAREALALVDDRSESPKETELRLLLTRAGVGPLATNHVVTGRAGFVARVDLAIVELRIAIEYEGDHHRDPSQWRRDIARRRRLDALGWIYLPVTQADLTDPRALLADLRAAVDRRP
ncbi:hypothetical protein [Microbacterium flavescens]|uniref:hypothetical protein n=1 Tax=Microbacterium flavescens TaxID=69366 RepID=UPI001BDF0415|nr:hypothetical protein [Microbacterium flavescens]